jgi:hypothetical protein
VHVLLWFLILLEEDDGYCSYSGVDRNGRHVNSLSNSVEVMREILPGLLHWTSFHKRIRQEVSSYYYKPSHALIDPRVPSEGLEWFKDRQPRVILLTNRHHYRHSGRFQEAFSCVGKCLPDG